MRIPVKIEYDEEHIRQIKNLGGQWDKLNKVWLIPLHSLPLLAHIPSIQKTWEAWQASQKAIYSAVEWGGLYNHQREAIKKALLYPSFGLFMDTGTGKTLTTIRILQAKKFQKVLIVTPLACLQVWKEELQKWAGIRGIVVYGSKKDRIRLLKAQGYHIINVDGIRILFDELMAMNYEALVVDESTHFKNIKADRTKKIIKLADKIPHKYILTGTPAPNGFEDYYSQIRIISEIWGNSFYTWRRKYFYPTGYGNFQWEITEKNKKELLRHIEACCYVCRKEDCLDLPDKKETPIYLEMEDKQRQAYYRLKRDFLLELEGKEITTQQVITQMMKLRQITSGFVYTDNGEVVKISDLKLKALKDILDMIPDKQVIIWHNFREEGEEIGKLLGLAPYTFLNEKQRREQLEAFKQGKQQYLIANLGSLSYGITLTNCQYAVYYSLDWNLEHILQSKDRIYRIGQEKKVQYFYLLCKDTIDMAIYSAVLQKKNSMEFEKDFIKNIKKILDK